MSRLILSNAFIDWLTRGGVIPDQTHRVVIDATVGQMVNIYVEMYGAEGLIQVEVPKELSGARVMILAPREPEEAPDA